MSRVLMRDEPGARKLAQCGLPIPERGGGPPLILTEGARIYGGQLAACQSPLRCAWCSPMQWDIAARTGLWYSNRHVRAGGWVAQTTLTVPHRKGTPFASSLELLLDGWRGLRKSRPLARAREEFDVVTPVAVQHVTWSPRAGFHPHLHVAWFARGDSSRGDELTEVVGEAWRHRISNMSGREGRPRSPAGSGGSVIMTTAGFWAYLAPDHPLHPTNDCGHPDHQGCDRCRKPDGGGRSGPGGSGGWGAGDWDSSPWDSGEHADDFFQWEQDFGGDEWDSDWGVDTPGMEILSGVGAAAERGDRQAGAVLREFFSATVNRARIVSQWGQLRRRFGSPPVEPVKPAARVEGRGRVWLHPRLVAAVELRRRRWGRGWINDGLQTAVDKDPWEAAEVWSVVTGEPVTVRRHDGDGAPVIGFDEDLVGVSGMRENYPRQ